jgi:hypothetical protein
MSCVDLDLMQELYFYVLADSVSITPEWFARRRYAR